MYITAFMLYFTQIILSSCTISSTWMLLFHLTIVHNNQMQTTAVSSLQLVTGKCRSAMNDITSCASRITYCQVDWAVMTFHLKRVVLIWMFEISRPTSNFLISFTSLTASFKINPYSLFTVFISFSTFSNLCILSEQAKTCTAFLPGPHWGSSQRSPRPPSRLGILHPPHSAPQFSHLRLSPSMPTLFPLPSSFYERRKRGFRPFLYL